MGGTLSQSVEIRELPMEFPQTEVKPEKIKAPREVTIRDGETVLKQPDMMIKLLEECGGNIEIYLACFNFKEKTSILSRTLYCLNSQGNESYLLKWHELIKSYRAAKILVQESQALKALEDMPVPDKKTPLRDWLMYAAFYQTEYREEMKIRARKWKPPEVDPNTVELIERMDQRKKERNGKSSLDDIDVFSPMAPENGELED